MSFREFLNEKVQIHIDDYNIRNGKNPNKKDQTYIMKGVKKFKGEIVDVTDKGAIAEFSNDSDARKFAQYANKAPNKTINVSL